MTQRIAVEGADQLALVLRRLPKADRILLTALRAGARVTHKEMIRRAPVRTIGGLKTRKGKGARAPGTLRKNIILRGRIPAAGEVEVLVGLGSKAFHGMFIEFGTRYVAARPFMRPAFDATANEALRVVGTKLGKDIEKAALKAAGRFGSSGFGAKRKRR